MARDPYGLPKMPTVDDLMKRAMPKGMYAGPDRRKKARLSTATLNELGLEAPGLSDADLPNADRRSAFTKVLDVLDIPRNAVFNAISWLGDVPTHKLRKGALGLKVVTGSDVLRHLGVKNKAVLGVGGLAADIFGDPLTYLGLGATTGLSIGKHVPKLLKPTVAALKGTGRAMAGLGGKIAPDFAKAIGRTPERLAKIGERYVRIAGKTLPDKAGMIRQAISPEQIAKNLMQTKRGGALTRRLARQVNRPGMAEEARKFIAAGSEKGRTIARLPGAARGIEAPFGKRRQLWETYAGLRPDETLAKITGHSAELKGLSEKVSKAKNAATNLAGAKETVPEVLPTAVQDQINAAIFSKTKGGKALSDASKAKIREHVLHYARNAPYPVPGGAKVESAIRAGRKAQSKIEAIRGKVIAAKTHPEASLPFKLETEQRLGHVYGAGKEGEGAIKKLMRTVGIAKQKYLGQGANELSRRTAAMEQGFGGGATSEGEVLKPIINRLSKPLVDKLAAAKNIPVEDVQSRLFDMVSHGVSPAKHARELHATDPAVARIAETWGWLTPAMKTEFGQVYKEAVKAKVFAARAAAKAKVPFGANQTNLAYVATEKAGQNAADKKIFEGLSSYTSPKVARHDFVVTDPVLRKALVRNKEAGWHWHNGNEVMVLTSNADQLRAMKKYAEAGKATDLGEKLISAEQWNTWSRQGPGAPGASLFKSDFKGDHFKKDIAESVASWVKQSRQHVTAGEARDIALNEGGKISKYMANKDTPGFGHMVSMKAVRESIAKSPLLQMIGKQLPDDLRVPQPVAAMLERLGKMSDADEMSQILRLANYPMRIWKPIALGHPGYMLRNFVQNYIGMALQGINPAAATKKFDEVRKLVQAVNSGKDVKGITITLAGRQIPAEKIIQQARLYNMLNSGFVSQIMDPTMYGKIKNMMPRLGKWWFHINNNIETTQRMSAWLTLIDEGMDFRQAALKTITAIPDLTDLTAFEKGARNVFPWFSWMRKNTENVARLALEKPSILPGTEHLRQAIQTTAVGDKNIDEELRPDWMQQQQAMQISGDDKMGNVWLLASWLPFNDLMNILEASQSPSEFARGILGQIRPDAKVFAEMATGSDIFRNKPIAPFTTEELFTTAMVPKALVGRSGTALDNLLALRAPREIARVAIDMPTVGGAALRGTIGGAIQPLTKERALYERMQALTEQGKKLRNAIKKAEAVGDKSAIPGLAKQWAQTQAEMYRLGLPGVAKSTQKSLAGRGVTAGEPAFAE